MEARLPYMDGRQQTSATRCTGQMGFQGSRVASMAPDAIAPGQGTRGWSGMISAVFRRWVKGARVEETRIASGEIAIHIVPAGDRITVAVAGRVTVDLSPALRSALLDLLHGGADPTVVIELSAVSYLDMSGLATLLEALNAAREGSVKLRLAGMSGQARALAEIAQLDTIYRNWGSEVEFR